MSSRPTYTPPSSPLGAPLPPTPPSPLPPLTVAEKARHCGAFLVGSAGGGLVIYLVAQGLRYSVLGWGEALLVGLIGGSGALVACAWALLPLWREWHASQEADLWQQNARHYYAQHYEALLAAQRAHTRAVLRPARPDPGPVINRPAPPTVTNVSTPPPASPDPAPPADPAPTWGDRARRMVEAFRGPAPATATPAPSAGDTQRLPALPEGADWRYHPAVPYTDTLRALVAVALATGTCSELQAKAMGVNRRAWERGCETLTGAEVFAPGLPGKPWQLSERVRRLRYDNDDAAVHSWIARRLAEEP